MKLYINITFANSYLPFSIKIELSIDLTSKTASTEQEKSHTLKENLRTQTEPISKFKATG